MFQLNGSLKQPAGLLKYVARLKLSDLFGTSNCKTLLWRHLTVEAVGVSICPEGRSPEGEMETHILRQFHGANKP